MSERVFYEVADLYNDASDYPFAVVAIYPDRPNGSGCVGVVKSLHYDRADAESIRAALAQPEAGGEHV